MNVLVWALRVQCALLCSYVNLRVMCVCVCISAGMQVFIVEFGHRERKKLVCVCIASNDEQH